MDVPVSDREGGREMRESVFRKGSTAAELEVKQKWKVYHDWEDAGRKKEPIRAVWTPLSVYKCWHNSHMSLLFTFLSSPRFLSHLFCASVCLQKLLPMATLIHKRTTDACRDIHTDSLPLIAANSMINMLIFVAALKGKAAAIQLNGLITTH